MFHSIVHMGSKYPKLLQSHPHGPQEIEEEEEEKREIGKRRGGRRRWRIRRRKRTK